MGTAAEEASHAGLLVGAAVEVTGFDGAASKLNGQRGRLVSQQGGRWAVKFDDPAFKDKKLLAANLLLVSDAGEVIGRAPASDAVEAEKKKRIAESVAKARCDRQAAEEEEAQRRAEQRERQVSTEGAEVASQGSSSASGHRDDAAADAWSQRRERVTKALIPGMKKLVAAQLGTGACEKLGRVEEMYERIGRGEIFEHEDELHGRRYAPGYVRGLEPVMAFHDPDSLPWCAELRQHWRAVHDELQRNLLEEIWTAGAYQASNAAYGSDWKIAGVFTADQWQKPEYWKQTQSIIKQLPGLDLFEAFFARMPPQTTIKAHSDNLNYILTAHLGLELEEGQCFMKVGNHERPWEEGGVLVFDTTYIHSARNDAERNRYVLVVRFWHPGLTEEERLAIHLSQAILAAAADPAKKVEVQRPVWTQ